MPAVTLIAVYFPEAFVHVLNHITSTQYSFNFFFFLGGGGGGVGGGGASYSNTV